MFCKNAKAVDFQETIEACEVQVDTYSQVNEYMIIYDTQGHLLTFVQGHLDSKCQTSFPQKNTSPFEAKFHMEPPWHIRIKMCSNVPGHMTKMTSRPFYDKNFQLINLFLRNQGADDLGTWYTALSAQVLPNLFN